MHHGAVATTPIKTSYEEIYHKYRRERLMQPEPAKLQAYRDIGVGADIMRFTEYGRPSSDFVRRAYY